MRLPEAVRDRERRLRGAGPEPIEGESRRIGQLRNVLYTEIIALDRFIDGHTPLANTLPLVRDNNVENCRPCGKRLASI